ncbi:MAG: TlpA disulfide reductase family protein [Phycisphaerales bacterium]
MKQLVAGVLAGVIFASPAAIAQADGAGAPAKAPEAKKKKRLGVGDPAPSLEGIKWLKGAPISGFEAGQVYVLDFWATWCGPCIRAIPHMNDIHKKMKDKGVNVVGLAVWTKTGPSIKPTKEFVDDKGDDMAYRIAEDVDDVLAKNYMQAARQNGIPCIFIVDQKGKIAWIGHPMDGMDEVLDQVVSGKFDPEAYGKAKAERQEIEEAFQGASNEGDHAKGLELADKLLKLDAKRYAQVEVYKYVALSKLGKGAEAKAAGSALLESTSDSELLNLLSWTIVDPQGDFSADLKPDADLALAAASKASELKGGKDASILDTLARAHFVKGEIAKAVEVQTKAIDVAPEEEFKEQLRSALEEYKTALEKKGG